MVLIWNWFGLLSSASVQCFDLRLFFRFCQFILRRSARVAIAAGCVAVSFGAVASETKAISYDELGRVNAVVYSGTVNNNQVHSICFDQAGNRIRYRSSSVGAVMVCNPFPAPPPPLPPPSQAPNILIADSAALEGEGISFAISLSSTAATPVSLTYATAAGTAASNDFVASSGTLTFAPGETSKNVVLPTIQDSRIEADEQFFVNLANPTNATITDAQGIGTILDDGDEGTGGGCPLC